MDQLVVDVYSTSVEPDIVFECIPLKDNVLRMTIFNQDVVNSFESVFQGF